MVLAHSTRCFGYTIAVVYLCIIFTAFIAIALYLDDVMRAFRKKRVLVNWDWYFGERMETSSLCEKDKKRKDRH